MAGGCFRITVGYSNGSASGHLPVAQVSSFLQSTTSPQYWLLIPNSHPSLILFTSERWSFNTFTSLNHHQSGPPYLRLDRILVAKPYTFQPAMIAFLLLLPLVLAAPLPHPNLSSAQLFFRPGRDQAAWSGPQKRDYDTDGLSSGMDHGVLAASATGPGRRSGAEPSGAHLDPRLFTSERDAQQPPAHSMPVTDFMLSDDITSNMAHALAALPMSTDSTDPSKRGLSIAQSIADLSTKLLHRFSRVARSSTNSIDGERDAAEIGGQGR